MKALRENSINVTGKVTVVWPQYDEEETIDMTEIGSKFNGAYCTNNSTICYVVDNEVFITPYTREAMAAIKAAGLVKKYFYVPCSNWDYPKSEKGKWERLLKMAQESHIRAFESDAEKWCDEHHVHKLDEKTLQRCFKIPRDGVQVKHQYWEVTHYPVVNATILDSAAIERLGKYCTNNGRVVFVYRDGNTYVARGYWIVDKLESAGYQKAGLFVPFSNGEEIMDPIIRERWENLSK